MQRLLTLLAATALLAACTTNDPTTASSAPAAPPASTAQDTPSTTSTAPAAPATNDKPADTPADDPGLAIRYNWGVPTEEVTVADRVSVPPVPVLVEVKAGDHTADGYERVTFAFRGANFPGYRFHYVKQVVQDGSGDPVHLPGRGYFQIVFNPASAHDDAGKATVPIGLQRPGFRQLSGYQLAGDYEAYVTYGFGFAASRPQVRIGERKRPDGTYVVAVDVRRA
ncbi:hypothetical protein KZZ52_52055 [Dactylosporangium sp. AC04546]|uniref:AMIN-like domain-containing (lipo)protein n=1 Tax=Dactylosporangium sp. AC04546 TaxID=2862460 RepID=UPI001EDFFC8A|nr:hypothetical protein [Dactylosporangium sp. AC04546]WVK82396.1 hypothetical protein KZZ52_52055 [Dactylosporangium sp. AC04546]